MLPQFQQLSLLRKFSLDELARLTDTEILQLFRAARWGQSDNPNEVVFPHCCIQSLKMRNKETNRDLAEFFGNKWDGFR